MRKFLIFLVMIMGMTSLAHAQFSGGGQGTPPPDQAAISNAAVDAGNAAYARRDFAAAAAQYASACDAGNASACGALGGMYLKGEGVRASGARAAGPLAKACDAGIATHCGSLGVLYDSGNGVSVNKARAFTLFNGACFRSDMASCLNLGRLYEQGQGTSVNLAQAASLYQSACNAGYGDGCSSVASMYARGAHFAKNDTQVLAFYKLACEKGEQNGCRNVAEIDKKKRLDAELAVEMRRLNEQEKKSAASAKFGAVQNSAGRPSCISIRETSYDKPNYKTVYNSARDPGVEVLSGYTTYNGPTMVDNNCNVNIVRIDLMSFLNYRYGAIHQPTLYTKDSIDNQVYWYVIEPGSTSRQGFPSDEYFYESEWRKIKASFEARKLKNLESEYRRVWDSAY